jgi:hypothetical protein
MRFLFLFERYFRKKTSFFNTHENIVLLFELNAEVQSRPCQILKDGPFKKAKVHQTMNTKRSKFNKGRIIRHFESNMKQAEISRLMGTPIVSSFGC